MSLSKARNNRTYPKREGTTKENLTNLLPISLTNADYRIISKALALRIKKILPHIIHNNQTGLVKG